MNEKSKLDLEINDAKDIEHLKTSNLDEVTDLNLYIYKPISLRFLKNFKNLKRLLISGNIKDYTPVSSCETLDVLYISTNGAIEDLNFIKNLSIKTLTLESFRTKSTHFSIPSLETIETLTISSVSALVDLAFLGEFKNLKHLSLFELQSNVLFDFTKLTNLEVLILTNMFNLKNLKALETIQRLDSLIIHQFYINRKIKTDVKSELLKVVADLRKIKAITLTLNNKEELIKELKFTS